MKADGFIKSFVYFVIFIEQTINWIDKPIVVWCNKPEYAYYNSNSFLISNGSRGASW